MPRPEVTTSILKCKVLLSDIGPLGDVVKPGSVNTSIEKVKLPVPVD